MPKRFTILLPLITLFFLISPNQVLAAKGDPCTGYNISTITDIAQPIPENSPEIKITLEGPLVGNFRLDFGGLFGLFGRPVIAESTGPDGKNNSVAVDGKVIITVNRDDNKLSRGTHTATLQSWQSGNVFDICDIRYKVGYEYNECSGSIRPPDPKHNEQFAYDVSNMAAGTYDIYIGILNTAKIPIEKVSGKQMTVGNDGKGTIELDPISPQNTNVALAVPTVDGLWLCKTHVKVGLSAGGAPRPIPTMAPPTSGTTPGTNTTSKVVTCTLTGTSPNSGIPTAIGCIPTEPVALVKALLKFTTAISGGIAFLLMVFGAFGMITSAGNPEALEASKDRFSKAVIGLLTVVFAVLLLKIIGVDILGLGTFLGV